MESLENWGIYKAIYETEVEFVHERKSLENIKIPTELKNQIVSVCGIGYNI